jgi:hypothetical protein
VAKFSCTPKSDNDNELDRQIRQRKAWKQGRNVVLTIENPNKTETNKRFIKVNAKDVWGEARHQKIYTMTGTAGG